MAKRLEEIMDEEACSRTRLIRKIFNGTIILKEAKETIDGVAYEMDLEKWRI